MAPEDMVTVEPTEDAATTRLDSVVRRRSLEVRQITVDGGDGDDASPIHDLLGGAFTPLLLEHSPSVRDTGALLTPHTRAAESEAPQNRDVKDVLPAVLIKTPHHRVWDEAVSHGYMHQYVVESPHGVFEVAGHVQETRSQGLGHDARHGHAPSCEGRGPG